MRFRRTRLGGGALLLAAAMVLGACGDDDDDSDGGSGSAVPAPTGAPVDLGYFNVENSPAGNYPDLRLGAEAAVKYVNDELGGVNGRPLRLEPCIVDGTGESSIACANKFVQGGKVAVSYGLDYGAAGGGPILTNAGIPVLGGIATEPVQLGSPNAFLFYGGITGAIPSVSRYVGEDLKAKKVSIIAADLPAAHLAVDTFSKPVLAKYGITDVNVVYESPTAADMTPALTKANEGDPDAIMLFLGGATCSKVMQGSQTVGIDPSKMVYVQVCTSNDQLEAGGAGANGILVQSPYLSPESDDPQVRIYREAMDAYDPSAPIGPISQAGFSSIMNIVDLMKKGPGDITRESIMAAASSAVDQPNFMGHPYTCGGKVVPNLPSICNVNERILTIKDGTYSDVLGGWVEGMSQVGP